MSAFEEFLSGKTTAADLKLKKPEAQKTDMKEVLDNQKILMEQNKKIIELLNKLVDNKVN